MHYLTPAEYARLVGISRQAVNDRINRKTLPFTLTKVSAKRIPVEDTEYEKIKREHEERLALVKGEA